MCPARAAEEAARFPAERFVAPGRLAAGVAKPTDRAAPNQFAALQARPVRRAGPEQAASRSAKPVRRGARAAARPTPALDSTRDHWGMAPAPAPPPVSVSVSAWAWRAALTPAGARVGPPQRLRPPPPARAAAGSP